MTNTAQAMSCILVDPSLFTAPYDAALTQGLLAAGVQPLWVTRPVRNGDREEIPAAYVTPLFYRRVDDAVRLPGPLRMFAKGCSHVLGLWRLLRLVAARKPDVIHIQWVVLPLLDIAALWWIHRARPLVITVHDTVPFNGNRLTLLQSLGFDMPIRLADRVIVHTAEGKRTLIGRGIAAEKISVVPHGPLRLHVSPRVDLSRRDPRWTFVLFGELKPYKGIDVLVEAAGRLEPHLRDRMRVIIAGRPRMDIAPIESRIHALDLDDTISLLPRRISEQEMADLFATADCFVFPYRTIDASGVFFLTRPLGKWIIASRVGVFAEQVREAAGELLPPDDVAALAAALERAVINRPAPRTSSADPSWDLIGSLTRAVYHEAALVHE
jgi:glycosyltransferase involved in cell wall biosynthesis